MGNPVVDLFPSSTELSITPVHSLDTESIQSGHRCDASGLVSGLPVCLSPLLPCKQNFAEGRARKNTKHVVDNTNMTHSTLVSIHSSNVNRNTSYPPRDKQSSQRSFRERTSLDHKQNSKVSGMKNLRERLSLSGVSGTVSSLIANPRRSSSIGNYESAWRTWVGWCRRRQTAPVSCNKTPVLDFLGELFDAGYEYRTISSHRLQSQHIIKLLMAKVWVPMTRSASFCQGYLICVHPSLSTLLYGMCKLFWNTLK